MNVIDASVWVSFLLESDLHHAQTKSWVFAYTRQNGLVTAPMVFAIEVGAAISRRTNSTDQARKTVSAVLDDPFFSLVDLDLPLTLASIEIATLLRLRSTDSIYVALAREFNLPLVTWDAEQQSRATRIIDVLTPNEALERSA